MKTKIRVAIIGAVIMVFVGVNIVSANEPVKFSYNGHWYAHEKICQTWTEAYMHAVNQTFFDPDSGNLLIGHLVTIQDATENEWVRKTFLSEYRQMWIGAYQFSHEGGLQDNWTWITGEKWEYTNWDTTEPGSFDEDYARMMNWSGHYGKWHDFPDENSNCSVLFTIVEYELPFYWSVGFEPPCDGGIYESLTVKKARCLPLKTEIMDQNYLPITDVEIGEFPPVLVLDAFIGSETTASVLVVDGLPVVQATSGNQFRFIGGRWCYNLKIKDYAPGTYILKMVSGNENLYHIAPSPKIKIVVEK